MNLIWLDLEMSGLDVQVNKIIEIAVIVTDTNFNILAEGPNLVIAQSQAHMKQMDDWCKNHHGKSGLTEAVLKSKLNEQDAENQVIEFIQDWVNKGESPMCGNSIGVDREFIKAYMPKLHSWFHYRNFDVSTMKMANNWWSETEFLKDVSDQHRAKHDILESIREAKFYRDKWYV